MYPVLREIQSYSVPVIGARPRRFLLRRLP